MRRSFILILLLFFAMSSLWSYDSGKQPFKAMSLSLLVPGGGQFYNESYYKAAFVFALEGFFIGRSIYNHDRKNHYYDKAMAADEDDYDHYMSLHNRYHGRRQNDFWWLGTVVFLSIVDAFVDAHLYNYQTEKDKIHILFGDSKLGIGINF